MSELVYHASIPIPSLLLTRTDVLGYGVIQVVPNFFIPVRNIAGGMALDPFRNVEAMESIMWFQSAESAWEWLQKGPRYHTWGGAP